MSRGIDRSPLALTSDGVVLLNVAMFDGPKKLDMLLHIAIREHGSVFVGVPLQPSEVKFALERQYDSTYEAACICAGSRQARWPRNGAGKK